jgi:hypothetical protein
MPVFTRTVPTTPASRTAVPPVTPNGIPVDFDLLVSQVEAPKVSVSFNVTLQATLNASLTNTGASDAHNVRVQIGARVGQSYLKLNNVEPLVVSIGDLPARATASQSLPIEIKMGLIQGNQAQNEGIVFEITVLSTERTKRFPDMRCTQSGCIYQ